MRNLVIDQLMALIEEGAEVYGYGPSIEPITDRKKLEELSNRELLDILISTVEFQG
jgi:hypothetical protein